jgi:hypothetical protein
VIVGIQKDQQVSAFFDASETQSWNNIVIQYPLSSKLSSQAITKISFLSTETQGLVVNYTRTDPWVVTLGPAVLILLATGSFSGFSSPKLPPNKLLPLFHTISQIRSH